MTLTTELCAEVIDHALPGGPSTPLETLGIINHAGHWLVSVHQWNWLRNRAVDLELRASITITDADWTASSLTLTSTGAFASYSFLEGDRIDITAGGTTGLYRIASRTDDDSIVLEESISATDLSGTVGGKLDNDQVALPTGFDFQQITAYAASNGLVSSFSLTTPQELLLIRTSNPGINTLSFWGLVSWVQQSGDQPIPRLEFYPPQTTAGRRLRIWYTAGWAELTSSDAIVPVPDFMSTLFLEACKAIALGHDKENEGAVMPRLDQLLGTLTFQLVKERDGMMHRDLGAITGGAMDVSSGRWSVFDNESRVANPT